MTIREFVPGDRAVYLAFSRDFYSGGAVLHPVDEGNLQATFDACVHFGGGQPRRLRAGVHHLEQRGGRHCRIAGGDLYCAGF